MRPQQKRKNAQDRTVPAQTPRLRLKPKAAPRRGYVDGAWWPRTDDLVAELPDLLAVLSVRLGRISRVLYRLNGSARVPKSFVAGGRAVRLDGYRLQPIDTLEVLGLGGGRLVLLVVPPRTDPGSAHATMMSAAEPNNADTVDGLLMITPDERDRRTLAASAQERWKSTRATASTSELVGVSG